MDETKIRLLEESWARSQGHGAALADTFYHRLFQLAPDLRELFTVTEMDSQNEKFRLMMGEVVRCVRHPEALRGILEASGRRHRDYGVRPRDYLPVGEAFLWALDRALPGGFTPEERDAWAEAYTLMASIMRNA